MTNHRVAASKKTARLPIFGYLCYNYDIILDVFFATNGGSIMRLGVSLVAALLMGILCLPTSVPAVGFERFEISNGKVKSNGQCGATLTESLKKATFWEKYPSLLDGTALAVKDLLGQFGLKDRRNP